MVREIVGDREADSFNLGGPSIVCLINAAQLLAERDLRVSFYSCNGNDVTGRKLREILRRTPVDITHYRDVEATSPSTYVLSDPTYHDGAGERTFVNDMAAAWQATPEILGEEFFDADIVLFGGTALVPHIHDNLTSLLGKAKQRGCTTVVTTVYDFLNEVRNPGKPWPLGESADSYGLIDLLIADHEEALRLSGRNSLDEAFETLVAKGVGALVVTNGNRPVSIYSGGELFGAFRGEIPISHAVEDARKTREVSGDTTGCGDNFAGGVLFSLTTDLLNGADPPSLPRACAWGIASGDFACFYLGGTYIEKSKGDKLAKVSAIYRDYVAEYHDKL